MKKINILLIVLLGFLVFTSCEDEISTKINPMAENGTLTFQLNNPIYTRYELTDANSTLDMINLTCAQPAYGFSASVIYTPEVCFDNKFAAGTYQSLSSQQGEKVGINTKELDKAMIALYGGKLPEPVVEKTVYFRLKATINDATHTAVTDSLIVKPVYSNSIKLTILPYVLPLFPYTEITPRLWFIVGLGDGKWTNSPDGLGKSLIPLSISEGKKYNLSGDGEFVYTGYFEAAKGFKLVRDYNVKGSEWAESWGMTGGVYKHNSGDNITVAADGFYKLTLNTVDNTLTIVPATISPTSYAKIGLIGSMSDSNWGVDFNMTPAFSSNNHIWYTTYEFKTDAQCKFRANSDWGTNWGPDTSSDGDPLYFPYGIGKNGKKNIGAKAGTYVIMLNDIDGTYFFIKK